MKRLLLSVVVSGVAVGLAPTLVAGSAHAAPAAPGDQIPIFTTQGTYVPATPTRVFDSRTTLKRQLKGGESVAVQVTGKGGVPTTGVSAVVINLTATRAARSGYLTAYPSTSSAGGTSNVLFAAGETRASLVTVPVGTDGKIKVLDGGGSAAGPVDAVVDVQGYYQDGSGAGEQFGSSYSTRGSGRILDTRTDGGAVKPNGTVTVTVSSGDSDLEQTPSALAVNLTAVSPTAPGYLTAWDGTSARPSTSNLNFVKGQTTPNNAVVPLTTSPTGGSATFSVFNGSVGSTQVLVDVVGAYYDGPFGARFVPLASPQRIVDTRTSTGTTKPGANTTRTVQAPSSVVSESGEGDTEALVGTLTAVRASESTYLTAYPSGDERPGVSNLNPAAGQTVANHAFIGLASDGRFDLYNFRGTTDVLVDVAGRFQDPLFIFPGGPTDTAKKAQAAKIAEQRAQHPVKAVKVTRSVG